MADEPEYADPERYAELVGFDNEWRDLWWNRDFLELMARRWRLGDVGRVLDVGCGAGHWTRTILGLLPSSAEAVGVDREEHFLELARKRLQAAGLGDRCRFEVGEAERLPFDDASFDWVTCQTLLMHVADPTAVLREFRRVLRPGGLLVAAEPDNMAGTLAQLKTSLDTPLEEQLELLRLQGVCERGKLELGEGDSSIGGRLPGYFHRAGFERVRAHQNDNCLTLIPPYDDQKMKLMIDQELRWARQEVSIFFGGKKDALRFFRAGGGADAEFEQGWSKSAAWLRAFEAGLGAGEFDSARGAVFYLVSGRAP